MRRTLLGIFLLLSSYLCGQTKQKKQDTFTIRIDKNVENANDKDEKEIIALWSAYLRSGEYKNPESSYWDRSEYQIPDYFLWPVNIKTLKSRTPAVQCTILGVFPVENDHFAIKTAIAHLGEENEIVLEAIISVYAKKINGKYLLVNSSQYHKGVWLQKKVGNITYYVHPNHTFDSEAATKMNNFNEKLARIFKVPAIPFDYFVSNYSREIVELWGYEYMAKIYIPGQTGGVADIRNRIIYAGNNSESYPHEVAHLYTHEVLDKGYLFLLDEGFATYMGGSGGHDLAWHTKKLSEFLASNPDFEISLAQIKGYIPNGLHSTEFRYVVGGIICKQIVEKHGMDTLLKGIASINTTQELYAFIKEKLEVSQKDFSDYIRKLLQ